MARKRGGGVPGRDPVERFKSFVKEDNETDCHLWQGATNSRGYGVFGFGGKGKSVLAHRWAYEYLGGKEIPEGLTIDHLCRTKACVNPEHLEAVTNKTNILRGDSPSAVNARATHCLNGHELAGENLLMRSDGRRVCRECGILRSRRHRENNAAE